MILNTLNGIAVMIAHTQDAAMSIPEQIMIQPPLSAILAKPTVIKRVASNAPYVALIVGFSMWSSRVMQLRQVSGGVPQLTHIEAAMKQKTKERERQSVEDEAYHANAREFGEAMDMPDTEPIWDELQSIRMD